MSSKMPPIGELTGRECLRASHGMYGWKVPLHPFASRTPTAFRKSSGEINRSISIKGRRSAWNQPASSPAPPFSINPGTPSSLKVFTASAA